MDHNVDPSIDAHKMNGFIAVYSAAGKAHSLLTFIKINVRR